MFEAQQVTTTYTLLHNYHNQYEVLKSSLKSLCTKRNNLLRQPFVNQPQGYNRLPKQKVEMFYNGNVRTFLKGGKEKVNVLKLNEYTWYFQLFKIF